MGKRKRINKKYERVVSSDKQTIATGISRIDAVFKDGMPIGIVPSMHNAGKSHYMTRNLVNSAMKKMHESGETTIIMRMEMSPSWYKELVKKQHAKED